MPFEPLLLMFVMLFLVPIIGGLFVLLPIYSGLYLALYLLYEPEEAGTLHPLDGMFADYSLILQQYQELYHFWMNQSSPDFMSLTLPLFGPVAGGVSLSAVLLFGFYRYVRNIFCVENL